jgi:hypothetical protein
LTSSEVAARGIAGQPLLASLEELLRSTVIEVLNDPIAAAKLGDAVLATQTLRTMRILSSAKKCRRVARRMAFTACSAGSLTGMDFCLIFALCKATMSQKSSLAQSAKSVA